MAKNSKTIAYMAVFTALATIANIYVIPLGGGGNFLSLVYIPCFFAGIFVGQMRDKPAMASQVFNSAKSL